MHRTYLHQGVAQRGRDATRDAGLSAGRGCLSKCLGVFIDEVKYRKTWGVTRCCNHKRPKSSLGVFCSLFIIIVVVVVFGWAIVYFCSHFSFLYPNGLHRCNALIYVCLMYGLPGFLDYAPNLVTKVIRSPGEATGGHRLQGLSRFKGFVVSEVTKTDVWGSLFFELLCLLLCSWPWQHFATRKGWKRLANGCHQRGEMYKKHW